MRKNEGFDLRVDQFAPAAAAENAVVAGTLDFKVCFLASRYAAAHVECCAGLA